MTDKLKVLDLFSGIGGFSLGLERTGGFETVAFCEIEEFPRKVLAKHWPGVPIYNDVRTLTKDVLDRDGITVDVITGGFPCQDISIAGQQAGIGSETRSGLWSEISRLIGELSPALVVVENVSNLLAGPSVKPGGWFGRILSDLAERGYDAEWENIPASAVGAPHRRERVWIVSYPKQKQRVCPVFAGYDAAQRAWGMPTFRLQNGVRFKMGQAVPTVSGGWMDKPDPSRMANGIADWPHRLGACGNAVVPQIPEMIGHAILASMQEGLDL